MFITDYCGNPIYIVNLGRRSLVLGGHYQLSDSNLSKRLALDSLARASSQVILESGLESISLESGLAIFLIELGLDLCPLSWDSNNSKLTPFTLELKARKRRVVWLIHSVKRNRLKLSLEARTREIR